MNYAAYRGVVNKKSNDFLHHAYVILNFAEKKYEMITNSVYNYQQPGSICWTAFLEMADLHENPPTTF